jgi:hypothetical protein
LYGFKEILTGFAVLNFGLEADGLRNMTVFTINK